MTTLIFPAVTQSALDYLDTARRRGEPVVAAASVYDAQAEAAFGTLSLLPYIYDGEFPQQFDALITSLGISKIYAPVASVHAFLEAFIAQKGLSLSLVGISPITQQVETYKKLLRKAEETENFVMACSDNKKSLPPLEIASIFRHTGTIYGESNDDKLAAMMAIFASAPKGDVIEIGSLLGKSASVMQYLAWHYQVGMMLSVDPLSPVLSVQMDSPLIIRTAMVDAWDYDIMHKALVMNLLPTAFGRFNFLRMDSERGFELYSKQRTISSPHFGDVKYSGKIAVIHIDGNHDFRQVNKDCELWLSHLTPGAWLILDDYIWLHGDGPHRVGDTLLEQRKKDIERAFVCGKALFIKFF